MAVALVIVMVAFHLSQKGFAGPTRGFAIGAIDLVTLAFTSWLLWRHRAAWLWAMWAIQVAGVPLDMMHFFHLPQGGGTSLRRALWWVNSVLAYAHIGVLALAAARRRFGPPYPLPEALAARVGA